MSGPTPPPLRAEASSSSSRIVVGGGAGREDAIETLIDMDPRGVAYRFARTMGVAPVAALRGRANLLTDAALFDAARALGGNEIVLPCRDYYDDDAAAAAAVGGGSTSSTRTATTTTTVDRDNGEDCPKKLSRVLRHHDKIVRVGNYGCGAGGGGASSSSSSSSSADGGDDNDRVAPPPALLAALRRTFGGSGRDRPDDDDDDGDGGDDVSEARGELPGLMHAVLNHGVFVGTSSSSSSSSSARLIRGVGRDRKNASRCGGEDEDDVEGDDEGGGCRRRTGGVGGRRPARGPGGVGGTGGAGNGDGDGDGALTPVALPEGERSVDRDDDDYDDDGIIADARRGANTRENPTAATSASSTRVVVPPPRAADLESVVGNACRDATRGTGTTNGRVHGLLIAALSIMTSRMLPRMEEEMDGPHDHSTWDVAAAADDGGAIGLRRAGSPTNAAACGTAGATLIALDPTDDAADPLAPLLQVGALLHALPRRDDDGLTGEFTLDEGLLRYFAVAASTYEERIEIQKANLFRRQSSFVGAAAASPGDATPSAGKPPPPPPSSSSSVVTILGGDADGGEEVRASVSEDGVVSSRDMPNLIDRANSEPESEYGADFDDQRGGADDPEGALADEDVEAEASRLLRHIVNIVGNHDDDDEDDSLDEDDSIDEDESSSESEHDEEDGSNEGASDNEGHEDDEGENEDNQAEENDDEDLQRALSLSLAAEINAESNFDELRSDGSNSNHSASSQLAGDAGSNVTDAATEVADGGEGAPANVGSTDAAAETSMTLVPVVDKAIKGGSTIEIAPNQDKDDIFLPLPPLPSPPPSSILPSQEHFAKIPSEEGKEEWKSNSDVDPSAVFEPSALSSFGKLPSSHVLVHLFRAVLALMLDHDDNTKKSSDDCNDDSRDVKPPNAADSIVSRFLSKQAAIAKKKDDQDKGVGEEEETKATNNIAFSPDSTTLLLLIASLHLSFHLRNSALAVLNDLLSHSDSNEKDFDAIVNFGVEDGFQIADSSSLESEATDDPLVEKDDPAGMEFAVISATIGTDAAMAASESLETKGLKRKAAAAAHVASLRNKTKQKLVEMWRKRVVFFSTCCYMNLRCLRVFTGKSMQRLVTPGSVEMSCSASSEEDSDARQAGALADVSISTKTRVALLSILSYFYSCAASKSIQSLMASMEYFFKQGDGSTSRADVDSQQDQFLVASLCTESLSLWGCALPLLYPDHSARVELLGSVLVSSQSSSAAALDVVSSKDDSTTTFVRAKSCVLTDYELQCQKIEILCKRLRVSDMLNCFVATPILVSSSAEAEFNHNKEGHINETSAVIQRDSGRPNPLPTISLLSTAIAERSSKGRNNSRDNLNKFYLALCQRAMTNLILWNDLSMSSNDANDHDISGGGELSISPGSAGGTGSHWADRGSLQVNPTKFSFDSSKCAESISVVSSSGSPAVTANQRATKVWGTVLSTTCFSPKSGVHRWAVKLDKCERGHVFVGVSTARVNLKTYVGGDSNGWGLIGTQALWHDRNKLRGDYGSTFRTGAVVVITLDTNVGTLSFGLWKDRSSSPESSTAPLSPQALMASPRRGAVPGSAGGPLIEDWGIAFEGLPLDVKLYPAVGMYQRDDRVTLCTISQSAVGAASSNGGNASSLLPLISSGDVYYPSLIRGEEDEHLSRVRSWNQYLCSDGVSFATEILTRSIHLLSSDNTLLTKADDVILMKILPCLASSISLIPSCIPTLSAKYAMALLPLVTRCAKLIDRMISSCDASLGIKLEPGEWAICVDSSTSESDLQGSNSEKYVVQLDRKITQGAEAEYSFYHGKQLNNLFSVIGASVGTHVQFVEEWCASESQGEGDGISFEECAQRSTASYIIDARLSLDGTRFEGMRHNVEKGTAERVTGSLQSPCTAENAQTNWVKTESLLCLAVGHLSLILCSQTSLSDVDKDAVEIGGAKRSLDTLLFTSPILSKGRLDRDGSSVPRAIDSVWDRFRSGDMHTDMVEQWQKLIYFDLVSATDSSRSREDATEMEEARNIIEQHSISAMSAQKGSLSPLCPQKYKSAQIAIASAIFYHTGGMTKDAQSEVASQSLRKSRQIMESGLREALAAAEAGVPRRKVCEDRCFLFTLLSQFLFEFPFPSDDKSTHSVVDDITHIFKSIKSRECLDYIKQQMHISTEKNILRYLGLRSLLLLLESEDNLEGVRVYAAIESALVSLPRLLCRPAAAISKSELEPNQGLTTHYTAIIPGCAASIQTCIHACTRRIYCYIGRVLLAEKGPLRDDCFSSSTSLLLVLLANYFTVFHANTHETISDILPSLKVIVAQCRDRVLCPTDDAETSSVAALLNVIRKQENRSLLQISASVLLSSCVQLSLGLFDSSHLVDLLSEHLLQEVSETYSLVVEETRLIRDREEMEAVQSDWINCDGSSGNRLKVNQSADKCDLLSKGLAYLSDHDTLFPKQGLVLSESSATIYFRQLLNVLHAVINSQYFIKSITKGAGALFSAFGFLLTDKDQDITTSPLKGGSTPLDGLPLRFAQRILRLLRPILFSMKADKLVIQQLFLMAGSVIDVSRVTNSGFHSQEDLLVARSSISLLRYVYTFSKSWRKEIHKVIVSCGSNESPVVCGVLAFFGGSPGLLQPGAFVVIEPEMAATSSVSTKSRSSGSSSAASNAAIASFGSGADEIVAGLCRQHCLSGVISSIDSRSGSCEVIILGDKYFQISPSIDRDSPLEDSRVTIRAVRVSAANISAADELPLVLDGTNVPADTIFSSFFDVLKSVSASIKAIDNALSGKEFNKLEINLEELMECSQGLRSATVLISDPRVLDKLVADESGGLQVLLARALLMGSLRNNDVRLSTLPEKEARFWHLCLVRLAVISRSKRLDTASPSSLKTLDGKIKSDGVSPVAQHVSKGYRTPPSFSAGFFGGGERASRSISSHEAAFNDRHEEDESASTVAAEQNVEDGGTESSDTAAAAHLREAAIVQMAELGLPRQWAELALSRVGGTNIEAAVHFCLERGGDMERLLAEDSQRRGPLSFLSSRRRGFGASQMTSNNLIRQLVEMGFPRHWCVEALSATRNNVDEALTWILTNGDRLSAADEEGHDDNDNGNDSEEEEEDGNDDEDEEESIVEANDQRVEDRPLSDENSKACQDTLTRNISWSGICPVRFISGRSSINPKTLEITGLPNGGFSSVGTKGVLLTSGKWYYEAEIRTAGCLQIGWADSSFVGHCQADRGDGCGDGPSSWAFDGWRRYRWHVNATEWGCKWTEGDTVGCFVDMDSMSVSFTLNGKGEEIGMGLAFSGEGFRPCNGVYACVSFNRREKLRLILGGKGTEPFKYPPPDGYRGIGEAIHDAARERNILMAEEKALIETHGSSNDESSALENKKYICDLSDGEHGHELFAWQHRYYGSDASVHLGSSRPGVLFGGSTNLKTLKNIVPTKNNNSTMADISLRLGNILMKENNPKTAGDESDSFGSRINLLRDAYNKIHDEVNKELKEVCASLCVLYSQKLVMHTMISHSNHFSLQSFLPTSSDTPWSLECADHEVSRRLWQVIEYCTSLQSSGWVGEAGAMAMAAEALGLGISAGDNKSNSMPAGMCAASANIDQVILACGGVTQFLTSATLPEATSENEFTSTNATFAACSENAIGREMGGTLSFIKSSLQSCAASSASFRQVLIAAIRRAIRLLAATEYTSDEGADSGQEDESELESKRSSSGEDSTGNSPDARLVSFLTGVFLSKPVSEQLSDIDNISVRCELFEAWCIGLFSASCPFRMVCAFTAAGILNTCPQALAYASSRMSIIANYLGGLESRVLRRSWAERAAVPVVSKYCQALIELLTSVKRSLKLCPNTYLPSCIKVDSATPLPFPPSDNSEKDKISSECKSWECSEGWVLSNTHWEVWTGSVEIMEVEWTTPPHSSVRTLMDGGDGPPFLREFCTVMRGTDWDADDDDGRALYEQDKLEKDQQKRASEEEKSKKAVEQVSEDMNEIDNNAGETESIDPACEEGPAGPEDDGQFASTPTAKKDIAEPEDEGDKKDDKPKKKKKKAVSSKLPLGTVLSIEPWNEVPAMARRIRWHLTGKEGVYRYGGGGGCFDIVHVETNEKETRVKKKHPYPETYEQCASRCGFGTRRTLHVILRLRNRSLISGETNCDGILEWPDFGAGVRVECTFFSDGAMSITEREVLYGSKDSGWESRFGQPNFVSGTVMVLSPTHELTSCDNSLLPYDELLGSNSFLVKHLRNKENGGGRIRVVSEMRLLRSKQSVDVKHVTAAANADEMESINMGVRSIHENPPLSFISSQPPPICFDPDFHAPSLSLSRDRRTVTCSASDGRGVAFGNVGFTKGVHYWEVKLEKADIGSVYIGVAEKPSGPTGSPQGISQGFDSQPRLNRWLGWGFVNYRATYSSGAERVYGAHCHAGDTVGVLLDCDAGRINYFIDGVKYGEHILNDLGCAFENISPFGFNADGCGSGGAGQGAPSGIDGGRTGRYPANGSVRPKALWPVIGLRHPDDRVTMSSKWMTSHGVDCAAVVKNILAVDEMLCVYERPQLSIMPKSTPEHSGFSLPQWLIEESFHEYNRWKSGRWRRSDTRGSSPCKLSSYGLDVDLDTSPFSCAAACASIGMSIALLPGDKVDIKRSAGRILELQEEAVVLGTYQGRLFYRLVSQKSEGGSLMEGGGRSWFWDESEAVDGGLQLIGEGLGLGVSLPKLSRFKPLCGGLKVVFKDGAVVRSDLEIVDGSSKSIGTIASGTVIPPNEIIERRVNSCGVVRYLIDHGSIRGWISSRIRGGKEEPIVEMMPLKHGENDDRSAGQPQYLTPEDSARDWYARYIEKVTPSKDADEINNISESMKIASIQEFGELLATGIINGLSELASDSIIATAYGRIADALPHSTEGACPFMDCALVLCALQLSNQEHLWAKSSSVNPMVYEVATKSLGAIDQLPSTRALMARIAMLRSFNRRAQYALPWLPMRSAQEGSAILGGLSGFGTSPERAGRTWDSKSKSLWVQPPSVSSRLRNCREILFANTKRKFLDSVIDATTTPTPLSHDEYELPREVRTVRINRLKAHRVMSSNDSSMMRKHSVFSQLQKEMRGWSGASLRRGFIAKGHGGQKRAFKVKLVGEGVNDYSGPYREVFADAIKEVTHIDASGCSSLGVLQPSPNNEADVGDMRNLVVFAHPSNDASGVSNMLERGNDQLSSEERDLLCSFSSLTHKKDENSREIEEALSYLGKLVGTGCRHGIPVDLPLSLGVVWKRLTEEAIDIVDIAKEIDVLALRGSNDEENNATSLPFHEMLATQRRLLNSFAEGLSCVLPVELLSMFTGDQLRDIMCGNPDIDVELLQRVVEYEGYNENDRVVNFFWEVLREMTTSQRKDFLQFVWARNRLPLRESDFDAPFKILKDPKPANEGGDMPPPGEYPLPSASTCFFSLTLPDYPEKEVLREKLLYAIQHVTTMESDYVTNDVEVSEGWRGL